MEDIMKKKFLHLVIPLSWIFLFQVLLLNDWTAAQDDQHKKHHHSGHHEAHHGGALNVISKCEIGHLEVRIEGDLLEAWFVGGGSDTHRSVPIQAEALNLAVTLPDGRKRTLVLKANPMKLAGEKTGHCSRFSARADWLQAVNEFEARGEIVFKGVQQQLLIKYPEGYDPDHSKQ
jgi:hypothetical protein